MDMEEISMKYFLLCGLAVLLASSCVARADSFYTSESAWAAALSGSPTTINFEGLVANNSAGYYGAGPGASITEGGVNFAIGPAGTDSYFFLIGDNFAYGYSMSVISIQTGGNRVPPLDLLVTLPSAVTALGFDFGGGAPSTATVTLSDGSVQMVAVPGNPGLTFFGATAPGGITTVDITLPASTGGILDMADFSYGTAGTTITPEPSSFLLLGSGLVGLAGLIKRKLMA
jgi:hypothetical protein